MLKDLPVEEIVARYEAGENTYELGRAYDVDDETIRRRLHAAGVKMRPRGAQPGNNNSRGGPPGNKYGAKRGGPLHTDGKGYIRTIDREGELCGIHRGCWAAYNGPIPKGHVVHHINGNILDNAIENLACMTNGEHCSLHHAG